MVEVILDGVPVVTVNGKTTTFKRLAGEENAWRATVDLNQVAASYDLFTGTSQVSSPVGPAEHKCFRPSRLR